MQICAAEKDVYDAPLSCQVAHMEPANRVCYIIGVQGRQAFRDGRSRDEMPVVWRVRMPEGVDEVNHQPPCGLAPLEEYVTASTVGECLSFPYCRRREECRPERCRSKTLTSDGEGAWHPNRNCPCIAKSATEVGANVTAECSFHREFFDHHGSFTIGFPWCAFYSSGMII